MLLARTRIIAAFRLVGVSQVFFYSFLYFDMSAAVNCHLVFGGTVGNVDKFNIKQPMERSRITKPLPVTRLVDLARTPSYPRRGVTHVR